MPMRVRLKSGIVLAALTVPLAAACSSGSSAPPAGPAAPSSASAQVPATAAGTAPATAPSGSDEAGGPETVKTGTSSLGTILTDGEGKTVYLWEHDPGTSSTCYGAFAQFWPPVLTAGAPVAGPGIQASLLGTATRNDGKVQVT